MKLIQLLLCCWAWVVLPGVMAAQALDGFSDISYFTSDNGLSQGEVTCILQDRQGFLWVGTRGGLNRYDGYQFEIFKNEIGNTNSLINNSIESLFEDQNGRIWIGTKSSGASVYDPIRDEFTHFAAHTLDTNTLSGDRVISIAESARGDIWLGSWNNGFSIYHPSTQQFTRHLPGRQVSDIITGSDGSMWVASSRGLYLFDQNGNQIDAFSHTRQPGDYESLVEDTERACLWIGTWRNGLFRFDIKSRSFEQFAHPPGSPYGLRANITYSLFKDGQNRIWTGTWGGGLLIFDPETGDFTRQELATGPYQNARKLYSEILCIFQDRSGIVWIGTNGGGLCKLNKNYNRFDLLKGNSQGTRGFPSNNPIWSVLEDQRGTLWVGTKGNGFLSYSGDSLSFKTLPFPEFSQATNDNLQILGGKVLYKRKDQSLWVGTHHGLYRILRKDDGRFQLQRSFDAPGRSIRGIKISSMVETSDGSFWIGTQQSGLNRVLTDQQKDTTYFYHYREGVDSTALQNQRISAMLEDRSGQLWVGTYGGLHLYLPKLDQFRSFTKITGNLQSLSSNIIICLYEDQKGRLWIGTPNGLNLALPGGEGQRCQFRSFQEKDGLPNNYIHGILEDDQGNLWISTNKGITKFNPEKEVFYSYDVNDGLQGNSFSESAAYKGKDGTLYFGGIYGLNYFHPDSITNDPTSPPVFITGIQIFNQPVIVGQPFNDRVILEKSLSETEKITLTHRENVFSLEFTALNFRKPHKNTYRYRLLGLEEAWNDVGSQRNVTYTNLRPGTYTFEVNAANNNQYRDENITSLQIRILPPFWATWQAYLVYTLILVGLLGIYHRVTSRQNQLKSKLELARLEQKKDAEVAELKTRFFTNITHELRTPLTLISGPVEELLQQEVTGSKSRNYIVTIHHHTQRLLALVNQLLDFRKAESGNMELQAARGNFVAFAREVYLSFQPMADKKNIDFRFEAEVNELPLYFDRDKMEIVLCNLLSNAFKYTPDGRRIEISIRKSDCTNMPEASMFSEGCGVISIRDNGIGMPAELVGKIFNRFYQIANTESVKMIGTGIGLSLVESIVELHHGKVEVQAETSKGSEFIVHLPLGNRHLKSDQLIPDFKNSEDLSLYTNSDLIAVELEKGSVLQTEPTPERARLPKVLIVEDNPRIRQFICSIFADRYQVLEAEDGKAGWQRAKTDAPALIISDVMMPEMDGIELCRRLKQHQSTCHTPIILLTARTSNVFQVEGYHSGADAYVTKPFQPNVLRAQVTGLLKARQRLREYFSRKITLQPSDIEITSEDEQFLKEAIQVIEVNINNEDLGKDFLAQAMAMSPSSLYRKVKSTTDLSINAFIRSIRLRRAAQLIQQTRYNISEVCYQVGFNDQKYFRKCFREQFGKNPSEYAGESIVTASNERR